jgi:glycosyltransferase involved in cell wall biosynthesis
MLPGNRMLSGHDVVCISSIDWDFLWQGHQEIMATLAAQGNRVLFVENTGVRRPRWSDLTRLMRRIQNRRRGPRGFRRERDGLVVYAPLILPFPYSRVVRPVNRALLDRALHRWMRATGVHQPILWTFLPTPLVHDLIRDLEPRLTIYYSIDNFAASSAQARRIRASEDHLLRAADLVFVTSEKLRERAAGFRSQVHVFPFGVSYRKFEQVRQSPDQGPPDVRDLARPVVGYVGGIHQWVDQALLDAVAARMPDASFVLVGPPLTDVSRLTHRSNVHLLGSRAHVDVPRYIKGFDVGLVPYRASDYTTHVYPTKLNEYLAMGIPVVSTDLPEVRRFNTEHGGMVAVARDPEAFADAIRVAAAATSPAEVARRISVARENSWERHIARMSELIEAALGHA